MKPFSWDLKAQGDRTVTGDQAQVSGTQGLVSCSLQPTVLGLCPWPQPMGMSMGAVCVCALVRVCLAGCVCVHTCVHVQLWCQGADRCCEGWTHPVLQHRDGDGHRVHIHHGAPAHPCLLFLAHPHSSLPSWATCSPRPLRLLPEGPQGLLVPLQALQPQIPPILLPPSSLAQLPQRWGPGPP